MTERQQGTVIVIAVLVLVSIIFLFTLVPMQRRDCGDAPAWACQSAPLSEEAKRASSTIWYRREDVVTFTREVKTACPPPTTQADSTCISTGTYGPEWVELDVDKIEDSARLNRLSGKAFGGIRLKRNGKVYAEIKAEEVSK